MTWNWDFGAQEALLLVVVGILLFGKRVPEICDWLKRRFSN